MSKISVTTIAGLTSGGDANKVKIESGDTLQVESNATVGGTASITGNATANSINLGGRGLGAGGTPLGVNFSSASTNGMQINDTNSGNLGGFMGFYSGSGAGTLRANIQNANNAGMHLCLGTNGTVVFGNTGYTAANALDEYEEGTWNPTVGGNATYNNQQGTYTKIGRYVFVRGDFHINAIGTGSTTTLSGLPFTSANLQGTPHGMISVGYFSNLSQNYTSIGGYVLNNSTGMYFSGSTSAATTIQLNGAATITSNTRILFSVSYITDS